MNTQGLEYANTLLSHYFLLRNYFRSRTWDRHEKIIQ